MFAAEKKVMKLDKEQKAYRKLCKGYLVEDGGYMVAMADGNTMLVMPNGTKTAKVSFAILHPNDTYNRKYGEFVALDRFFERGEFCTMPLDYIDRIVFQD